MGVLNVTPDSFSDGGRFLDPDAAVAHGLAMVAEGADVVDVGGESTRPGAEPVGRGRGAAGGSSRSSRRSPATCGSASTPATPRWPRPPWPPGPRWSTTCRRRSAPVAAAAGPGVGCVAMHMQGDPRTMQDDPRYDDVVAEVARVPRRAGRRPPRTPGVDEVWIDPGIGFGKTVAHNLALLAHLDALVATGFPVVVGTSRKRFLGALLAAADGLRPGRDGRRRTTGSRARSPRRCGRCGRVRGWSGPTTCGPPSRPPRRSSGPSTNGPTGPEGRRRTTVPPMKGKWAQGIKPRNFAWVIKDRLAVCERPGGYGANHRQVRRQEEIIWIREQGFTTVISVIPAPHNLHNYDELDVAVAPPARSPTHDDADRYLADVPARAAGAARRRREGARPRRRARRPGAGPHGRLPALGRHGRRRPHRRHGHRAAARPASSGPLGRELVATVASIPGAKGA